MGLIYAFLAYLSWGLVVPVHFRLLDGIPPGAILAYRIVWSMVFVAGLLFVMRKRLANPFPLRPRHALLIATAFVIGLNWLLYLVAVGSGRMLDASLGYFINPLVSVALGALVLGERLRPLQRVAVGIAVLGVAVAVVMAGRLPLLSLTLAISFALYGLFRKIAAVDPMIGFTVETALLLPVAVGYIAVSPEASVPHDTRTILLLMLTGVTTPLPLIWFGAAAQRLSLSTLGLMQYIAPTGLLVLGVLYYGETLPPDRIVLFGLIWLALVIYAGDSLRAAREERKPGKAVGTASERSGAPCPVAAVPAVRGQGG